MYNRKEGKVNCFELGKIENFQNKMLSLLPHSFYIIFFYLKWMHFFRFFNKCNVILVFFNNFWVIAEKIATILCRKHFIFMPLSSLSSFATTQVTHKKRLEFRGYHSLKSLCCLVITMLS